MNSEEQQKANQFMENVRLSNPITIRCTGKLRQELKMDFNETDPETVHPIFYELKTKVVVRNLLQVWKLQSKLAYDAASYFGTIKYENTNMTKAAERMLKELREGVKERKYSIAQTINEQPEITETDEEPLTPEEIEAWADDMEVKDDETRKRTAEFLSR